MKERRVIEQRSITIALYQPITYQGKELTEITLNPPTVKQFRQAQQKYRQGMSPEKVTEFNVALVAKCAGITEEAVEEMAGDDFVYALEFASDFFDSGENSEKDST